MSALAIVVLMASCNEPDPYTQSSAGLECLKFTDIGVEVYAVSHWDKNSDGCVNKNEADGITSIPDNAFQGNQGIFSISDFNQFPNLTNIGNNAFANCSNLTTVNLTNIQTVGENAFSGCTSLTTVTLPAVTTVANNAFENCPSITQVNSPVPINTSACTNGQVKCADGNTQALICANGQWTVQANCPNGCTGGICNAPQPVCINGETKCSDDHAHSLICSSGQWIINGNCANGCTAGKCNSFPVTCTDNDVKCSDDGTQALICDSNQWNTKEHCSNGCTNGVCNPVVQPVCTNNDVKCSNDGTQTLICSNNQWVAKDNCTNGCANGVCNPVVQPGCTNNDVKCSDDSKQTLICSNNQWVVKDNCTNGCTNGVCTPVVQPVCTNNDVKCSDNGKQTLICSNNQWVAKDNCTNGCANGVCNPVVQAVCTNNDVKCSDNGTQTLICSNNQWTVKDTCTNGCSNGACNTDPSSCADGAKKCTDNDTRTLLCVSNQWMYNETCTHGCTNGVCNIPVYDCINGTQKCADNGTDLMHCENNLWVKTETCAYQCNSVLNECKEAPLTGPCETNGQLQCNNDVLKKCINKEWKLYEECEHGCKNAQCNMCTPGTRACGDTIGKTYYASFICEGDKWTYDDHCSLFAVDCESGSGYCESCWKEREGELWCYGGQIYRCTDLQWKRAELCVNYDCGFEEEPSRCYTTPYNQFKCSDDKTKSLYSDGFGWKIVDDCGGPVCSDETGKCHDKVFYCGNMPLSDIKFDWYMSFMQSTENEEPNYEEFVTNHPTGTFNDWCAQFENRIGVCQEYKSNPRFNWKDYFGGDCYLPCSPEDEGQAFTTCESYYFGDDEWKEADYINYHGAHGDISICPYAFSTDIASRYVCTKVGNQYVYFPIDSVNNCECGSNSLCSLLSYNEATWEYDGCKKYHPDCPNNCVNGCDYSQKCICPLKCHGKCDENGQCLDYPCSDSCTYGCWYSEDPTQCLDPSKCNCQHEHLGPSVWEYTCEYSECYDFFPDDWY